MNSKRLLPTLAALLAAASASAQTVLIDATTLNGSFEDGSGTGQGSTIDLWAPALNSNNEQRINNNASVGTYSAVIGNTTLDETATTNLADPVFNGLVLNTGHTVASGETFDLSFDWIPLFKWDADDQIDFRLFTTSDNTTGGTVSEIYVSNVTGHAQGDGYQSDLDLTGIGTVQAANVGQDLWIEFWSSTAAGVVNDAPGEFARVDNVNLSVIPEPGTLALVGVALAALALSRRR